MMADSSGNAVFLEVCFAQIITPWGAGNNKNVNKGFYPWIFKNVAGTGWGISGGEREKTSVFWNQLVGYKVAI